MKVHSVNISVKFLIIFLIISSISNANIETSTNEVKLSIADYRYQYPHCCWAAVSQTVLQYYKVYKTQADIIQWASSGQQVINYTCNHDNPKSIDKILFNFANIPIQSDSCANNYIDINIIKREIDNDRPIIILAGYKWGPPKNEWLDEGLYCIIYGYSPTSPAYHIYYQDPENDNIFGGYRMLRYDTLVSVFIDHDDVSNCDLYQKWKETLTLGGSNSNPPGPNPPFNPANQNTISQRVIPAVITTIFQTILKRIP